MKKIWPFSFYLLYFGAGACVFPYFVLYYQSLGFTGAQIGLLSAIAPLISLIGAPFWTGIADTTGRHKLIMSLAILVALGVVLYKVLARARAGRLGQDASAWKLGPWPVDPTAVRTREEWIRAFEYLSVLRLGPAARHWHHLAIAAGLGRFSRKAVSTRGWGDASTERRRAAEQLAFLYERARYAPPGEPLPETALATAQRDLCLLAGVPVS